MYEIIDIRPTETGQNIEVEWSDGKFRYSQSFPTDVTPERIDKLTEILSPRREVVKERCHDLRQHYRLD